MSPAARRLEHRVSGVRLHLRRRAALAAALWLAGGVGLLLMLAWLAVGGDGWRQGSNVPAVLDGAMVLWVLSGVVLFRMGAARWFSEVPLARTIDRAAGLRSGSVRGSLELSRDVPEGVSDTLATRAVLRTVMDLERRADAELAGDLGRRVERWTKRGMGFATTFAVALVVVSVLWPARAARVWAGVASPLATMVDPVLPPLAVLPGDAEVLRGTDVELAIAAEGRIEVVLAWQAAGEVARSETLVVADGRASHVFPSISAAVEYRVRDRHGSETATYRIVPIDPLFVSDLVLGVVYPPHTGIAPDEYRGDPPPLRLPVGSTLTFEGLASRPLATVQLVDSTGAGAVSFDVDESSFRGSWRPTRGGTFDWAFRDTAGDPAEIQPEPLDVLMVPDSAPGVSIPLPGRDTILPMNLRQPLILEAHDDYGLRRLELVAYRVTAFGERREPVVQGSDLGGTRAALARPVLDVSSWGLLPGDTVRYFARAVDNGPAGQTGASREYVLRMPAATELQREAEETLGDVADRLQELAEEAAQQAEENREQAMEAEAQRADAQGDPDSEFEEREELEAALQDQAEMSSSVDSLRQELDALERMMEEAGQADPELSRELDELQELIDEMAGEELQRRMDEMAEALEQDDLARATESLEELAAEQEEFRERIEEAIERFQRAAVEQDFRATTQEAEELARQEQALADAMEEADDPELRGEQQQELMERAEELEGRMDTLQERLEELGEQRAAEGVQEARESSQQAREQMEQAQQQVDQGDSQEAAEDAQEAAEQMEQAAQQLQSAQQQMAQQQMEQQIQAMRRTADDALSLARRQNELRERMRGATREELAEMRNEEASLQRGLQNMAENLQVATEAAAGGNPEISAQMGRTMESIEETLEAMEDQRGNRTSAASEAEEAIGNLNQLALMAMAVASQMGRPGQGQGGEEVGQQLEQLAQQQGDIMNQTGQLMPMQLGEQAMSQQLQQLSEGQNSVAGDLGELADEPGSEESLGDLSELAREAQLLAQELTQGRLTPDLVQRQERLFHRLLDAGRSLEREEFSEERESEEPGEFERGDVLPLSAGDLGAMPYRLPDADQLQGLAPAVRQLVLEYFERLNRPRSGGGS